MLRRIGMCALLAIFVIGMVTAQGCNTMRGVGKDVEAGGKAIQRGASK